MVAGVGCVGWWLWHMYFFLLLAPGGVGGGGKEQTQTITQLTLVFADAD